MSADALKARHAAFLTIIDEIHKLNCAQIRDLAARSGVHWVTLHGWAAGRVVSPRVNTLFAVAVALGYTIEVKKGARRLRSVA